MIKKLNYVYCQPDHLWKGNNTIRELNKINSISKKDVKSCLAIQALWKVHILLPKEINHPHYKVTKSDHQHQFDLFYVTHNVFKGNAYKCILTGVNITSIYKVARALRVKKASKVAFVLKAIQCV